MKPKTIWVIVDLDQYDHELAQFLYWSNSQGWVDYETATPFSTIEKETLKLPPGGHWEQVPTIWNSKFRIAAVKTIREFESFLKTETQQEILICGDEYLQLEDNIRKVLLDHFHGGLLDE